MVDEAGEYEFQAFGDDRAAFQLHLDDGTTKQSITNDNAKIADNALKLAQQNMIIRVELNQLPLQ